MPATEIAGATAIVTGASRGFGREIATALTGEGATVVGVARDGDALAQVQSGLGGAFIPVTGDATDPTLAGTLIDTYRPTLIVLNAGAAPLPRSLQRHTWETFSRNWEVDVRHAFHWLRESLLAPLSPGSTVIAMSSGAALFGSPMSGGYAGSKATIRFITSYAADESNRADLGIRYISVLPKLTPATGLGSAAVTAYAARQGVSEADYLQSSGPVLSAEQAGKAIAALAADPAYDQQAYLLSAEGLRPLP